jgi:phage gp36-like protein
MENFISIDDYKAKITDQRLLLLIGKDTDILDDAEATAIAVITDLLSDRYDMDAVFAAEGDERSKSVVRWVSNLVMYYLHERIADKLVPKRIEDNYKETMSNLQLIAKGELPAVLPRKTNDDETVKTKFRWGSNTAHSH